jgi:hypothetical protein
VDLYAVNTGGSDRPGNAEDHQQDQKETSHTNLPGKRGG